MPEIKVPFYGHVRQYHSIKKELDEAIQQVLESGQYVMGPALTPFRAGVSPATPAPNTPSASTPAPTPSGWCSWPWA